MRNRGIEKAIAIMGTETALAKHLGRKQPVISQYLSGTAPVPLSLALKLEHDSKLRIPRWMTRPDVFKEEGCHKLT